MVQTRRNRALIERYLTLYVMHVTGKMYEKNPLLRIMEEEIRDTIRTLEHLLFLSGEKIDYLRKIALEFHGLDDEVPLVLKALPTTDHDSELDSEHATAVKEPGYDHTTMKSPTTSDLVNQLSSSPILADKRKKTHPSMRYDDNNDE